MRSVFISISAIILIACASDKTKSRANSKYALVDVASTIDTCLKTLYIDKSSVESRQFNEYWIKAQKEGYTFNDDTIVPFGKIVFAPKSAKYYKDTLIIADCKIFDSINIHRMEIHRSKPSENNHYPDLKIEEWQFKDSASALVYSNALKGYIENGYGLKSPLRVIQKGNSDNFGNENHEAGYFGWLSNNLPDYDFSNSIPTNVFTRTGNQRPEIVPHQDFDHPFVRDYYYGITKTEAEKRINEMFKGIEKHETPRKL